MGESKVDRGSGDFLKDMGYADPDAMRVKIALANKIALAIEARSVSLEDASFLAALPIDLLGHIVEGRVKGIDVETLQSALTNIEEAE